MSDTWTLSGNSVESTNQDQALWPVSLPDKSGSFTNLTTDPWTINIPNLSNSAGQKRKLSQETPPSPSYTSKQCKIGNLKIALYYLLTEEYRLLLTISNNFDRLSDQMNDLTN